MHFGRRERERQRRTQRERESWCFEPSQPQRNFISTSKLHVSRDITPQSCFLSPSLYSARTQHGNLHPAKWPTLFCWSTKEPVLAAANTNSKLLFTTRLFTSSTLKHTLDMVQSLHIYHETVHFYPETCTEHGPVSSHLPWDCSLLLPWNIHWTWSRLFTFTMRLLISSSQNVYTKLKMGFTCLTVYHKNVRNTCDQGSSGLFFFPTEKA